MVFVSIPQLGRPCAWRLPRRIRLYLLVQRCEQLPRRLVSAPGSVSACGEDVYQKFLGSIYRLATFHLVLSFVSVLTSVPVLFTTQMYHRLGDQWASSLLAFIALACCAIPFLFYFMGARIRRSSKYAYVEPEEQDEEKKVGAH